MAILLSVGLPVGYVLIGMFVSRCIYSYAYNNGGLLERGDHDQAAAMAFFFWPLLGAIVGIMYFITNGVRKQRKPKKEKIKS